MSSKGPFKYTQEIACLLNLQQFILFLIQLKDLYYATTHSCHYKKFRLQRRKFCKSTSMKTFCDVAYENVAICNEQRKPSLPATFIITSQSATFIVASQLATFYHYVAGCDVYVASQLATFIVTLQVATFTITSQFATFILTSLNGRFS